VRHGRGGRSGEAFPFTNNGEGIWRLLGRVSGVNCKAVLESTGSLWLRIYEALEDHGVERRARAHAPVQDIEKTFKTIEATVAELAKRGIDLGAPERAFYQTSVPKSLLDLLRRKDLDFFSGLRVGELLDLSKFFLYLF
jgi:transposase